MKPLFAFGLALVTWQAASAHFVWIGSTSKDGKVIVTSGFGEVGEYEAKYADRIKQAKYWAEDASGKKTPLTMTLDANQGEYRGEATGKPSVIFATCDYGLFQRGNGPAGHLMYTAKRIVDASPTFKDPKPRKELRVEILAEFTADKAKLRVIHHGKPAADAEIKFFGPNDKGGTLKTNAEGFAEWKLEAPGEYSCYVGRNVEKSGELDGKKFQTERDYATLTFKHGASAKAISQALPSLPEGFSSFGAAITDGFVYVYGGHKGVTHTYSTETVHGKFRRLNLATPSTGWEELPEGPIAQGVALVAHRGVLYRIGGMQPRNKVGEKADNISLASCAAFDPKTNKWTAIAPLPEPRSSFDAVVVADKIFLFGGWTMQGSGQSSTWSENGLVLDLADKSAKWQPLPQPFQRRALNIAEANGRIYLVGGLTPDGETDPATEVFDIASKIWSKAAAIPGGQRNAFSPAVCAMGGRIYASPADGVVYRLDSEGWTKVGSVQHKRIVHRIVPTADKRLVVLGGAARGTNVAETEVVELK